MLGRQDYRCLNYNSINYSTPDLFQNGSQLLMGLRVYKPVVYLKRIQKMQGKTTLQMTELYNLIITVLLTDFKWFTNC